MNCLDILENLVIDKIIKSRIPGRCVLILSDGSSVFALIDTVLEIGLNKDKSISDEQIQLLQTALKINKLKAYSMRLCEGFARSEFQIRQKLKLKDFPIEEIDNTIIRLKELGLINDKKFAENFINYSIRKKWGIGKIVRELEIRKVKSDDYYDLIEVLCDENDFFSNALQTAEKKLRMLKSKPEIKQKDSIFRNLITKGYSYDIAKKVLQKLFSTN